MKKFMVALSLLLVVCGCHDDIQDEKVVVGFPSLSSPVDLCLAVFDAWIGIDKALYDYNECIKNS